MEQNTKHTDYSELFAKYLSQTANEEELQAIKHIVASDKYAAQELFTLRKIHAALHNTRTDNYSRSEAQLLKTITKPKRLKRRLYSLSAVAASIVLALGIFYSIFLYSPTETYDFTAETQDSVLFVMLPNGSSVTLNAYSSLTTQNNSAYEYFLSGEAYFKVNESAHRFTVHTKDIRVQVTGTSFNIRENKLDNTVSVHVNEGIVKVFYNTEVHIVQTGEIFSLRNTVTDIAPALILADAWKTGVYIFNETPLFEVISTLNNRFNLNLSASNELENLTITATFYDTDKEEIVPILSSLLLADIQVEGTTIFFYRK